MPHRLVGDAAFFQRAEIRDVLAWLRLLADPATRPPWSGLWPARRSSCARSTSRAARRSRAGASSTWWPRSTRRIESPQVPPEARERIHVFLKLYRAGARRDRHDAPRPVRAPPDRAPRPAPPAAVRRAGGRRRAAARLARFGELAAALVRAVAAGHAARVRSLDRRGGRLRAARAGGARPAGAAARRSGHGHRCGGRARGRPRVRARPARRAHAGPGAAPLEPIPDALLQEALPPDTRRAQAPRARGCCTWR